jgi:hypothetical protein
MDLSRNPEQIKLLWLRYPNLPLVMANSFEEFIDSFGPDPDAGWEPNPDWPYP